MIVSLAGDADTFRSWSGDYSNEAKSKGKNADSPAEPFLLSEGLPLVPGKLVGQDTKGGVVDMVDLLLDNIEALCRQAESETPPDAVGIVRRPTVRVWIWQVKNVEGSVFFCYQH